MIETTKIDVRHVPESKLSSIDFAHMPFGRVYSDHMFVADYIDGDWRGFCIEPYEKMSFLPGLAILHYGQSVFEGLKAYRGQQGEVKIFRPEMNAKRLNVSAERMCIPQLPEEIFFNGLTELLKLDKGWVPNAPDTSLYIRPFIFAMDEYMGIRPSETYRFIIFTCPVGAYYSKPVRVKIETKYSRTVEGGTGFAKAAGNYAGSLYPARLAQKQGYDQLIWTDGKTHQYVEEAGTMNLIFMIDGVLVTAETGDTVLKGITRESVLTIAREWGVPVEERRVSVKEILDAIEEGTLEEAFGTGTAATIAHIETIGYEGRDFDLPAVKESNFSCRVRKELDDMKTGKIDDRHGWIFNI
jgi:branched-chain amino acid aminotransferase